MGRKGANGVQMKVEVYAPLLIRQLCFNKTKQHLPTIPSQKRKVMNKVLNNISWHNYFESLVVVAVAYYAYIGWQFYRPEIERLIARFRGENDEHVLPEALRYKGEIPAPAPPIDTAQFQRGRAGKPEENLDLLFPYTGEAFTLASQLKACIAGVTEKPFAPEALITKLKNIINDYPDIAASPDREEVNAFVVNECERTGTALLSESEVDSWWSA